MATLNPYLYFYGNTLEAFNFYKSVFGGEFAMVQRYGNMPPCPEASKLSAEDSEKIMHVSLPIGQGNVLMGSDALESMGPSFTIGDNFSISINTESKEEAEKIFNGLAAEGKTTMPLADSFWGAYFGMLIDKFGVNWMVNYDYKRTQPRA